MKRLPFYWLQRLDTLGHKLRLPRRVFGLLCDEYERRLQESFDWGAGYVSRTSASSSSVTFTAQRKPHDA